MSKQHSKVDSNYHRYFLSGLICQDNDMLSLNGLGVARVLEGSKQDYHVTEYQLASDFKLRFSDYGDMWIDVPSSSIELVVNDLPVKHNIVVISSSFLFVILYSHLKSNYKVSVLKKDSSVGTYRVSVYPNNIYYPLQYGSIALLAIEDSLTDNGDSCLIKAETDIQFSECGFYLHDLTTGKFYREANDIFEITTSLNDFVYCPFIVSNSVEYRGVVKHFMR